MRQDLIDQLYAKYPRIYSKPLDGIWCRDGWFNLIDTLSMLMEGHLDVFPIELQGQIYATQIKESLEL